MAVSEKVKLDGDTVLVSLSDGTKTIEWDIASDTAVLLTISQPSTVSYESQNIKYEGEKKDGKWETRPLTVTWSAEEEKQIQVWEKARTPLTYTIANYYEEDVVYEDCRVRLSDPAHVVPKQDNYVPMTIEVSCMGNPYEDGKEA